MYDILQNNVYDAQTVKETLEACERAADRLQKKVADHMVYEAMWKIFGSFELELRYLLLTSDSSQAIHRFSTKD